jgi:hypothetical protein
VDTKSDKSNCGGCGKACAAGRTCSNGSCGSCVVGFKNDGPGDQGSIQYAQSVWNGDYPFSIQAIPQPGSDFSTCQSCQAKMAYSGGQNYEYSHDPIGFDTNYNAFLGGVQPYVYVCTYPFCNMVHACGNVTVSLTVSGPNCSLGGPTSFEMDSSQACQ